MRQEEAVRNEKLRVMQEKVYAEAKQQMDDELLRRGATTNMNNSNHLYCS